MKINFRFVFLLGTRFPSARISSPPLDETTIPLTNGDIPHDNQSLIDIIFSRLTSPFGKRSKLSSTHSHQRYVNGVIKSDTDNFIYHQLNLDQINDENNNNQNSDDLIVHIPNHHYQHQTDSFKSTDMTFLHICVIGGVSLIYFLWFIFVAGISIVHLIIYSALLFLYCISDRTRRFALAILIYLTYLLFYDALHLIPNYTVSNIHIKDIYLIEKKYFGIARQGQVLTLNEYFKENHHPFFDVLSGLCYLNW